MKKLLTLLFITAAALMPGTSLYSSGDPITTQKTFSDEDIKSLAGVYVTNNLQISNPALVDVDLDGDFDILVFKEGNVEYYKNTGTLEKPFFVPENMKYDKYNSASIFDLSLPYPVFFADKNGDNSPDMFVIKDKVYNTQQQKTEYKVMYSENVLGLDTGVLITIVLVLLIIVLVLAIL